MPRVGANIPAPNLVPQEDPDVPSQSLVSELWFIELTGATTGADLPELEQAPKAGTEWLIVYLTVTNVSELDETFSVSDLSLFIEEQTDPIPVAASSLRRVAREVGLEPQNGRTVVVPAGSSAEIVAVFSVPLVATDPRPVVGGQELSLSSALANTPFD